MKKFFFTLTLFAAVTSVAQAQKKDIRLGLTAGAVFANYTAKSDGQTDSGNSLVGPTFGVLVNVPAGKNVSFQPAVNFVRKGTKEEQTLSGVTTKVKLTINCIEVPLNVLYNKAVTSGTFFIGGGPSVAVNLSGKGSYDDGSTSITGDISFGSDADDDFKSLDAGLNFLTGFRFTKGLIIAANYNAGLSNILNDDSGGGTFKSHYFGIRLGWLLQPAGKK